MAVTASFSPTNSDLRRVGYIGLRARPLVFWSGVAFFIFMPVIFAVVAVVSMYGNPRFSWLPILIFLVVPLLAAAGFYNIPVLLYGKSPALRGEHTYTFEDGEIHARSPAFDTRISWEIVTSCYTHSLGIMFYSGKAPVISIPRRALVGKGFNELVELVRRKGISVGGNV